MSKKRYFDSEEYAKDPFLEEEENNLHEFEAMLNTQDILPFDKRFSVGDKVKGNIVNQNIENLFIDIGGKSTGILPITEFSSQGLATPSLGDSVTAYVLKDTGSEILLSNSFKHSESDPVFLKKAFSDGIPIQATITRVVNSGFVSKIGRSSAFIPLSHMELQKIEDKDKYLGQTLSFHIIEFKNSGRDLILSRRSLLREEKEKNIRNELEGLDLDKTVKAKISKITDFGAFAVFGSLEGLIPISELSWGHVKKVSDLVTVGDYVSVKIIKIEREPRIKITLSLKDAKADPWLTIESRYSPGDKVEGYVTKLIDKGAFVSLEDEVDAFVPVTHITWERRLTHPRERLSVGDKISAYVLSLDPHEKKIALTIKGKAPEKLKRTFLLTRDKNDNERELKRIYDEYLQKEEEIFAKKPSQDNVFSQAFSKAQKKAGKF